MIKKYLIVPAVAYPIYNFSVNSYMTSSFLQNYITLSCLIILMISIPKLFNLNFSNTRKRFSCWIYRPVCWEFSYFAPQSPYAYCYGSKNSWFSSDRNINKN